MSEYRILVLRDCYLSIDHLPLKKLALMLENLVYFLEQHLKQCQKCFYSGEKCKVCLDPSQLVRSYQVDRVSICKRCNMLGHKECMFTHI